MAQPDASRIRVLVACASERRHVATRRWRVIEGTILGVQSSQLSAAAIANRLEFPTSLVQQQLDADTAVSLRAQMAAQARLPVAAEGLTILLFLVRCA
eukprot:1188909-Rhodomonas_salina.2